MNQPKKDIKKEKVVSAKGDEAEEIVLAYLVDQNRPYGATDISANLKNRVSKPQAAKALASLLEKQEIMGKTYGKVIVYCARQTESATLSSEEATALECEIATLKAQEAVLKEELKTLTSQKMVLISTPRTVDLERLLAEITNKCDVLNASLVPLRASSSTTATEPAEPTISSAANTALDASFNSARAIATKRKKIGKEVQGMLMDCFDKKKGEEAEAWETVGVELDATEEGVWIELAELEVREKAGAKAAKAKK